MVFYENGKKVRYNPYHMKVDERVDEGLDVVVYKIGNEVVKFYKDYCGKIRLTKEECEYLSLIITQRILLPNVSLLDKKHQIRGYKMTFVEDLGEDSFYTLNREDLKEEMTFVHNDVIHLSNQHVLIEDFNLKNTVFHKGIYLVDSGSFQIDKSQKKDNHIRIYGINMDVLNEYLLCVILKHCCFNVSKRNVTTKKMLDSICCDINDKNMDVLTYLMDGMEYDSILDMALHKYNEVKYGNQEKRGEVQKVKKI